MQIRNNWVPCGVSLRHFPTASHGGGQARKYGFPRSFFEFFYVRAEIKVVLRVRFHPLLHHAVRPMTTEPFAHSSGASQVRFVLCLHRI